MLITHQLQIIQKIIYQTSIAKHDLPLQFKNQNLLQIIQMLQIDEIKIKPTEV